MNNNLISIIRTHVCNTPEKVFNYLKVDNDTIEITYADLWNSACQFSEKLKKSNVNKGDILGIMLPHGYDIYSSFLGTMIYGAVPSLFPQLSDRQDPTVFWKSHRVVFERTPIRHLIIDEPFQNLLNKNISNSDINFITPIESDNKFSYKATDIADEPLNTDLALLQHSSGSTDVKKGVALSHQAIIGQIETYRKSINLNGDKDQLIASWLPLYHDMGLITGFLLPIITGTPVVTLDPFKWVMRPTQLLQIIENYKATHAWLPNFAFHHISGAAHDNDKWDLSSLRFLINCSEPCKTETFNLFIEKFGSMGLAKNALNTCYAMAETVFAVTQSPTTSPVQTFKKDGKLWLSSGKALSDVVIEVCDVEDGTPLPEGELGEIRLQCPYLFESYWNLPDKTAEQLSDGKYYTRDLGFLVQGELYVVGRTDDVINIRGRKFMANDLEFSVRQIAGIKKGRIVAFSEFDPKIGSQRAVMVAEKCESDSTLSALELAKNIRTHLELAVGLRIEKVEVVPSGWLIKTTSGKMNRKLNAKKYKEMKSEF